MSKNYLLFFFDLCKKNWVLRTTSNFVRVGSKLLFCYFASLGGYVTIFCMCQMLHLPWIKDIV